MSSRRELTDSPFDTLEKTFDLLVTGPRPLALDGTTISGLPHREVPLGELQAMLLHPSMSFAVRDRVVGTLVARAKAEGGAWSVGLAGVLLPGLRRAAWPLVQSCPDKADDIEAETLAAFLAAVARCHPGRARLAARLCWLARIGATRLLRRELAEVGRPAGDPVSAAPPRPWSHPDFVLDHAVRAEIIKTSDAELIGATRLGDVPIEDAANALGLEYWACVKRRSRAEQKLGAWLTSEEYSSIEIVQKRAETPCSSSGSRPRPDRKADRRPGKRRSSPPPRR
jgi:DNA-directed RNA polymerase specialized sigma24 family protein